VSLLGKTFCQENLFAEYAGDFLHTAEGDSIKDHTYVYYFKAGSYDIGNINFFALQWNVLSAVSNKFQSVGSNFIDV
jgi:hypothetical protein